MPAPVLQFDNVAKSYPRPGREDRVALHRASFEIPGGKIVSMVGRSGSGKSTLLHLAAGIDVPTRGRITLLGEDLAGLDEHRRTLLRRKHVGLIFQFFHLLSHLSVRDNIALPEWIGGGGGRGLDQRIDALLERVGLADRASDPIQKLSGGEMQRVAICRALLQKPRLLLADEPTGNLDDDNSRLVMDLLLQLAREEGSSLIYVTHSSELAGLADASWSIHSGVLDTA